MKLIKLTYFFSLFSVFFSFANLQAQESENFFVFGITNKFGTPHDSLKNCLEKALEEADIKVARVSYREVINDNFKECKGENFKKFKKKIEEMSIYNDIRDDEIKSFVESNKDYRVIRGAVDCINSSNPKEKYNFIMKKVLEKVEENRGEKKAVLLSTIKDGRDVDSFREKYAKRFVLISATSTSEEREKNIRNILKKKYKEETIKAIINGSKSAEKFDNKDAENFYDAIDKGDFYISKLVKSDKGEDKFVEKKISRFVNLLFGNPYISPTEDEQGMFFAYASSLRSIDIARQVGAAIVKDGSLISTGANEVVGFGGKPFFDDMDMENSKLKDNRDYKLGYYSNKRFFKENVLDPLCVYDGVKKIEENFKKFRNLCSSFELKISCLAEIEQTLEGFKENIKDVKDLEKLAPDFNKSIGEIIGKNLGIADEENKILKSFLMGNFNDGFDEKKDIKENIKSYLSIGISEIKANTIEYFRATHGEMCAILDASRIGKSVAGATLYTTTFPCHLCTQGIITSGIGKVVFWQTYLKSKMTSMYDGIVDVNQKDKSSSTLPFEWFDGISPLRYADLFAFRKIHYDNGKKCHKKKIYDGTDCIRGWNIKENISYEYFKNR